MEVHRGPASHLLMYVGRFPSVGSEIWRFCSLGIYTYSYVSFLPRLLVQLDASPPNKQSNGDGELISTSHDSKLVGQTQSTMHVFQSTPKSDDAVAILRARGKCDDSPIIWEAMMRRHSCSKGTRSDELNLHFKSSTIFSKILDP